MSAGAFATFGVDTCRFTEVFPGVKPTLAVLAGLFMIPILREYIMSGGRSISAKSNTFYYLKRNFAFQKWISAIIFLLQTGLCPVSKSSLVHLLSKSGKGNAVVIVIGGAAESLASSPGVNTVVVRQRKGFVRMALEFGWELGLTQREYISFTLVEPEHTDKTTDGVPQGWPGACLLIRREWALSAGHFPRWKPGSEATRPVQKGYGLCPVSVHWWAHGAGALQDSTHHRW